MEQYEMMAEMHLGKFIAESREISQALNEFADKLEQIEKKYADKTESKEEQIERAYIIRVVGSGSDTSLGRIYLTDEEASIINYAAEDENWENPTIPDEDPPWFTIWREDELIDCQKEMLRMEGWSFDKGEE